MTHTIFPFLFFFAVAKALKEIEESRQQDKMRIKTRCGTSLVGGEKLDVCVQHFGNCYVVMASMLPVPAVVLRCEADAFDGVGGLEEQYTTTVLLGRDDMPLSVVGRQLVQEVAKTSRKPVFLYLGVHPRLTADDVAHTTIKEVLEAVDACRMW